jgi:hypothetical protein
LLSTGQLRSLTRLGRATADWIMSAMGSALPIDRSGRQLGR